MSLRDKLLSQKVTLSAAGLVLLLLLAGLFLWIEDMRVVGLIVLGCLVSFFIVLNGIQRLSVTDTRAEATSRTLKVASDALFCLRNGLSAASAAELCSLLLPQTDAEGIAATDTLVVLADKGLVPDYCIVGTPISLTVQKVLESKKMQTFSERDLPAPEQTQGSPRIIVPLLVQNRALGTLIFYYHRNIEIDRTQTAVAQGLGELLSTQLSSYELDRQAELTVKAEIKALQAQINPHFLFNVLNTIASFTRTSPTKARDLLHEFSFFYRRVLESSEQTFIPLSQELRQVKSYLNIERARFGESRIDVLEHVDGACLEVPVPPFLIQPLVENSIHHALRDEGVLTIDIRAVVVGCDMLMSVVDDGLGMESDAAEELLKDIAARQTAVLGGSEDARGTITGSTGAAGAAGSTSGAGMALHNVAERISRFYGAGSGIEIVSRSGEGTCVTLVLKDALTIHGNKGEETLCM